MPEGKKQDHGVNRPAAALSVEEMEVRKAEIHAQRVAQRAELTQKLYSEGAIDLADKIAACGQPTSLTCTHCGNQHPVETRCKRRWCPTCTRKISFDRVVKYEKRLGNLQWPLWVTLTMKNSDDERIVEELKAGWKQFRRKKIFTSHTKGGLWALEVTERGCGWHPHIHAMLDCEWLAYNVPKPSPHDSPDAVRQKLDYARNELAEEWGSCVGQEWAVALAVRKKGSEAARELLKYAMKGSDLLETLLPIAPIIRQIDSGRTISTFGSLRKNKQPETAEDDAPGLACTNCGVEKSWLPTEIVSRYHGFAPPPMIHFENDEFRRRNTNS